MSNISRYGTTGHPDADAVTANALVGEHAGNVTAHQADEQFALAQFSTAPFKGGPKVKVAKPIPMRHKDGVPLCIAKNNTCGSWRMVGSEYCRWHKL